MYLEYAISQEMIRIYSNILLLEKQQVAAPSKACFLSLHGPLNASFLTKTGECEKFSIGAAWSL